MQDKLTRNRVQGTGWPSTGPIRAAGAQLEHQRAAEEAWETKPEELAGTVGERAPLAKYPRRIIVAGDVRARELLVDKLPTNLASKAVIVDREVPVDSPELAAAAEQVLRQLEDARLPAAAGDVPQPARPGRAGLLPAQDDDHAPG